MLIPKYSATQSFRAKDIEALDEMISEWCSRNTIIISHMTLLNDKESTFVIALIAYDVKEMMKESTKMDRLKKKLDYPVGQKDIHL